MKAKKSNKTISAIDDALSGSQWKSFKKSSSVNQTVVSVGHFSPEIKMDRTLVDGGLISGGPEPVAATGVKYSKEMTRGNLADFYKGMKACAASGYMPGVTVETIEKLRQEMNKSHPEEYDMVADIIVVEYPDEKTAGEAMKNQSDTAEGNLYNSQIPGAPAGMDLEKVLNSKVVQAQMTPTQKAQMDKMQSLMKSSAPKIKAEREKSGLQNEQGTVLGRPAVFLIQDEKKRFCIAVRVKNYLITGSLLYSYESLPDGATPCESVSQFDSKKISERVEGATYHRTEVSPKTSTIGAEGFLNKDEVEKIFEKLFSKLN
ncbi:MAG: hypothetical protein WC080_02670 [Patescibacteria group bacterium]|jgi:hypothetical protein